MLAIISSLVVSLLVNSGLKVEADLVRPSTCAAAWEFSNSSGWCYYFSKTYASYDIAAKRCQNVGGTLVTFQRYKEMVYLQRLFVERSETEDRCDDSDNCLLYWIGMTSATPNPTDPRNWFWTDISYRLKDELRPYLVHNTRLCAALRFKYFGNYTFGGYVADNCDQALRYICKKFVGCPEGYTATPFNRNCYRVIPRRMTFEQAIVSCIYESTYPGHLTYITNEEQSADVTRWVMDQANTTRNDCFEHDLADVRLWIGAYRNVTDNCTMPFHWNLGEGLEFDVTFTNWHQPAHLCTINREFCVYIQKRYNYTWVDDDCTNLKLCPLCQRYP